MGHRHTTGRFGEGLAARTLEKEGWTILARRWRDGPRELDLVVARDGVLAFVEVKTRRTEDPAQALAAVTRSKRREVERAAGAWLRHEGARLSLEWPGIGPLRQIRFDVMVVVLPPGRRPVILRVEGAWVREDRSR